MSLQKLGLIKADNVQDIRDIAVDQARKFAVILWPSQSQYLFDPSCTDPDDGNLFIQPTVGRGRWRKA